MPWPKKIARQEFNSPNASEININVNSNNIGWYFGTDGKPPAGFNDLVTVILHEIGHGLGFNSGNLSSTSNCFSNPSIYAYYIHNGSGQQLVDESIFPNNRCSEGGSDEIKAEFTSNNIFFNRPGNAFIAQLYAPSPFSAGSSISHLDEAAYPAGNENQLMTPELSGVTHDPGPLALEMFAEMGWVYTYFDHQPFADMETLDQPFKVSITSDTVLLSNQLILHYSLDNFTTENMEILQATSNPDEFEATLSVGTNVDLAYYFSVIDTLGREFTLPGKAPEEVFTFFIGEDIEAPAISHNPLNVVLSTSTSEVITTEITDNIGINTAIVEYSINNVDQTPVNLALSNEIENQFEGDLIIPVGSAKGDILNYRIVVTDASSNNNQATLPASGFFEVEINEFDAVSFYRNDFDASTKDFIGNEFIIDTPVGFVNGGIHSPHPYPDGFGANLESDLIYQLAIPIIVDSENADMIFDEVVLVEPGDSASVFGDENFKDYVVVEATNDNGANWVALIPGYDANDNFEWLEKYNSIVNGVNSGGNGNRLLFKPRTIDLAQTFNPGESIFIRFRLHTNSVANGWGWAIDNLQIQEEIVGIEDFVNISKFLNIFPNPSEGRFQIEVKGLDFSEPLNIEIINIMGRIVYKKIIEYPQETINQSADLSHLDAGLYLVNSWQGSQRASRKILLQK